MRPRELRGALKAVPSSERIRLVDRLELTQLQLRVRRVVVGCENSSVDLVLVVGGVAAGWAEGREA